MTRILLCGSEPVLAKGLETVLRAGGNFELLPACRSALELVESHASGNVPDVVLLDMTPDVTFALLSELRRSLNDTKIILWVKAVSRETALQSMALGLCGILRKQLPVELQVKCLQTVAAGGAWFEKELMDDALNSNHVLLTVREEELVRLLAHGLKNKEIADRLETSEEALNFDLLRLFSKTGVRDRFELALFGLQRLNGRIWGQGSRSQIAASPNGQCGLSPYPACQPEI